MGMPEILDSLAVDLAKEHGAIIQYILHSVQVRGTGAQMSIMEAAREEMWHMEWLVEAIRERGGTPTLDRAEVALSEGIVKNVQSDIAAEMGALAHYERTLEVIGDQDDELTRLIERIMDDERYHRTAFTGIAERIGTEGEGAYTPTPGVSPSDAGAAAPMMGLEYEGLLQYLWNKYGTGEGEASESYFELAINEMRHMYWVGTCFGGLPLRVVPVPEDQVVAVGDEEAAVHRAGEYEEKAAGVISQVSGAVAGERIASEMRRIDYQHDYHRFLLQHMERQGATTVGGGA